jgi:exopolysaccharide biosynthesis polyprenyl glycosylphosphotransferase
VPPAAAPSAAGSTRLATERLLAASRPSVLGPVAGAAVLAALSPGEARVRTAVLAFTVFAGAAAACRQLAPHAALLPLMRVVYSGVAPCLGGAILATLWLLTGADGVGPTAMAAAVAACTLVSQPWPASRRWPPALGAGRRVAFAGSAAGAFRLARALDLGGSSEYLLVGRIEVGEDRAPGDGDRVAPVLGRLDALERLIVEHGIDVVVMGGDASRLAVFERVASSCLHLPVRVVDVPGLYEEVFGHVPMAEIDALWFQCVADPHVRLARRPAKRVVDLVIAAMLAVVTLPLVGLLAALVRSDGGPWLFEQTRIGEGGRPFHLYKLRTMRVGSGTEAQWAELEDPRITRIGRFLRRMHLDELPQLANVLRGDMSLVGPRPEQPEFVDRLERTLPYYQRRHLSRPGITGWAQIRCGYAGSDVGSAWKLSHDLYYLKHRSVALDGLIVAETLATLVFDRQPVLRPETLDFVLGHAPLEPAAVATSAPLAVRASGVASGTGAL